MPLTANDLIQKYLLLPHPEGGYYKETYRSQGSIPQDALPPQFNGDRSFATAIYFLLEKGNFSAFHRIQSDECWHFYAGEPLNVHVINTDGSYQRVVLGNEEGIFQAVVPAGSWFASESTGSFSFVGCTVAPGFDFADFELAEAAVLEEKYPEQSTLIKRLCRS